MNILSTGRTVARVVRTKSSFMAVGHVHFLSTLTVSLFLITGCSVVRCLARMPAAKVHEEKLPHGIVKKQDSTPGAGWWDVRYPCVVVTMVVAKAWSQL